MHLYIRANESLRFIDITEKPEQEEEDGRKTGRKDRILMTDSVEPIDPKVRFSVTF